MLIEFTQKHMEELPVDGLTTEQFLNVAIESSKVLGWVFSNINATGFIAHTNNGIFSWNAEVRLKVYSGSAHIQSRSRDDNVIEFGKNKENIRHFISTFKEIEKTLMPEKVALEYSNG